jgi:transposase-like protein
MDSLEASGRRRRRRHSAEFKAELVASCQQPGVSLAAIAMDHGINPNLLRRWVIEHERLGHHELVQAPGVQRDVAAQFIALPLPEPQTASPTSGHAEDIVIDLRHNGLTASIRWPMARADRCATWLRDVMR